MTDKIKFNILKHAGDPTHYKKGETIFRKGEMGNCMFVVAEGEVNIVLDGNAVDHLKEGELFGEMALIDRQKRSADAVASTDCALIQIDEKRFLFMTQNTPMFALQMMRMVAIRLRERMADIQRMNAE